MEDKGPLDVFLKYQAYAQNSGYPQKASDVLQRLPVDLAKPRRTKRGARPDTSTDDYNCGKPNARSRSAEVCGQGLFLGTNLRPMVLQDASG